MKELLDTDRVNFLVWRYLLESNYRETAAKLQKEWRIPQAPHKHFDFAPHVSHHALVTTLNKGLIYEDYQRQFAAQAQQVARDLPAAAGAMPGGVFGPLKFEPAQNDGEGDEEEEEEEEEEESDADAEPDGIENSRKRQIDGQYASLPNGSPRAKRPRLSNGYENGAEATTPMEIDHADNNHAYPSPLEGEQTASPLPRTEGPEQGTQVDKVHELAQETVFLQLGEVPSETSPVRIHENPIVLHCEWSPQDPSILAGAGTDALARIWTISHAAESDNQRNHVNGTTHPFRNLIEDDVPSNATVTAMAWNWDGTAIALAIETENKTRIGIWAPDGTNLHRFDGPEPPVIKLRWCPNNDYILGIGPENGGTLVTVFSSLLSNSISHFLPDHDLHADPLDATWISESEFILCGGDILASLRCTETGIVPGRQFSTHVEEAFSQVHFDSRSKLVATGSDKGIIDLWDESGQRHSISAHIGMITALQWQPLQGEAPEDERLLASGGEDGAICIWNVRNLDVKPKYSMTMDNPIVALSMTPDGAFIAGATNTRVLIWKLGDHAIPRASWTRTAHPGWLSPRVNGDVEEEYLPCLGWDSAGQKLVYAANSRLAVINFS